MTELPGSDPGDDAATTASSSASIPGHGGVIAAVGLPGVRQDENGSGVLWCECVHGGWIIEGTREAVAPHIQGEAVFAVAPNTDGGVLLFTSAHPNGRPAAISAAKRVVSLAYRSCSPGQRAALLVSTLPADGRPGAFGVLNAGMFAGRWLFVAAQRSPKWPTDVAPLSAASHAETLESLGWDVAGGVRLNARRPPPVEFAHLRRQ